MGERGELDSKLAEEIRARVLGDGFMKIVQTVRRGGSVFKIAMRPVEIGGEKKFQAEMTDAGQVRVKNFDANGAAEGLEEIIAQKGARDLHLMTATGDLHVRVTKKGHVMTSRSGAMQRVAELRPHDRVKKTPLTEFDSSILLRALGITDGDDKVKASMRGKLDQVNEFLKVVSELVEGADREKQFVCVDCGCGKAYLTVALHFYLKCAKGFKDVKTIGIDLKGDVIEGVQRIAARLDAANELLFFEADLEKFDLKSAGVERADLVCSLHACDTATDEALARGVEWKAAYVVCAPCCQHELQKTITGANVVKGVEAFSGLLRHGILRERMCDILTDSFRAMIMRILGFKVQVIEFVSPDATARNILLKCEYGIKPGQPGVVSEYLNLRDFWKVTPWLETRMEKLLSKYFSRFE